MTNSYYARYRTTTHVPLLGGVVSSQTSRFEDRAEAEERLRQVIEINGPRCVGEVYPSSSPPEIFIHCGSGPSQAIGGHCFRCHKKLTLADAKQKAKENRAAKRAASR